MSLTGEFLHAVERGNWTSSEGWSVIKYSAYLNNRLERECLISEVGNVESGHEKFTMIEIDFDNDKDELQLFIREYFYYSPLLSLFVGEYK